MFRISRLNNNCSGIAIAGSTGGEGNQPTDSLVAGVAGAEFKVAARRLNPEAGQHRDRPAVPIRRSAACQRHRTADVIDRVGPARLTTCDVNRPSTSASGFLIVGAEARRQRHLASHAVVRRRFTGGQNDVTAAHVDFVFVPRVILVRLGGPYEEAHATPGALLCRSRREKDSSRVAVAGSPRGDVHGTAHARAARVGGLKEDAPAGLLRAVATRQPNGPARAMWLLFGVDRGTSRHKDVTADAGGAIPDRQDNVSAAALLGAPSIHGDLPRRALSRHARAKVDAPTDPAAPRVGGQ